MGGCRPPREMEELLAGRRHSIHRPSSLPPHPPCLTSTPHLQTPHSHSFLLSHIRVLTIGTALVMSLKTLLVAGTVRYFGFPWRTSLAVGLTMAHIGEFSFVLLSTSAQLDILPPQVRARAAALLNKSSSSPMGRPMGL
jgi:hypothetical protein